ncbi:MAG: helix-turn-helix domain-containing protein [Bryobacteraceae bacterium]
MKQASRQKPIEGGSLGDKLLRSAQQARDWVNGKPARVRVTYVPAPRVDVRKLRARMGLSQTQFAARFGFSLDSIQNWEQGHRQPEGPARTLLVVIAKNPKAVEAALGSS